VDVVKRYGWAAGHTSAGWQVADVCDEHFDGGVFVVLLRQTFHHLGVEDVADLSVRRQVMLVVLQDRVHSLHAPSQTSTTTYFVQLPASAGCTTLLALAAC